MWWSRCRPPPPFPLGAQQGHTASPSAPRRVNRPPHPVPRTERAHACTGEVSRSNGGTGSPTWSWPSDRKSYGRHLVVGFVDARSTTAQWTFPTSPVGVLAGQLRTGAALRKAQARRETLIPRGPGIRIAIGVVLGVSP